MQSIQLAGMGQSALAWESAIHARPSCQHILSCIMQHFYNVDNHELMNSLPSNLTEKSSQTKRRQTPFKCTVCVMLWVCCSATLNLQPFVAQQPHDRSKAGALWEHPSSS